MMTPDLPTHRVLRFLLRVTLLCALTATGVHAQESSLSMRPVGGGFYEVTFLSLEKSPDSGVDLRIQIEDDPRVVGELEVTCSGVRNVTVDAQLAYKALNRSRAKEIQDLISLSLEPAENGLVLALEFANELKSELSSGDPRAKIQITVPEGTHLDVDAPYLRFSSRGLIEGASVGEAFSPVDISGARGHLQINALNTRVSVENHSGSFEIDNNNGRVILTDVTVTNLESPASSSAHARTENADVIVNRYSGPIHFHVVRGKIRGRSVSLAGMRSSLRNSGGLIDMRFDSVAPTARLEVRNSHESVHLRFSEDISATFNLTASENGSIDLLNIPHRVGKVADDRFEAVAGDGLAQIRVNTKFGGDIRIDGHR